MIEKYFSEEDAILVSVADNGTSISITCSCPDWSQSQRRIITVSDIGLGKALGIDLKDYTREGFIEEIKTAFPVRLQGLYKVPDWELPIPEEWRDMAKRHITSLKEQRMFYTVDAEYIRNQDPPLFAYTLLTEIEDEYQRNMSKDSRASHFPSDLGSLLKNPEVLFKPEIIHVGDRI